MEEIAQALGISHCSVSTILHDPIGMRKLTACWVPKSLSDDQMATRASVCSALKHFRSKDDFLLRLVTVDETQPSAGKVMATVFWDAKGIMLDFLPKRSTITGVYYANLLDQLRTAIHDKCRGKVYKGVLLQHDNTGVHTCKLAMAAVGRNGHVLIPHSAYLPDLPPGDFFLFPNLNKTCHRDRTARLTAPCPSHKEL